MSIRHHRFFVPGKPAPQGSKKAWAAKGRNGYTGKVVMREQSAGVAPYRATLVEAFRAIAEIEGPMEGPLGVDVRFGFTRPKKPAHDYPKSNGDVDKLQRAVGDALTTSGLISDDSQIVLWTAQKTYTTGEPFTKVFVYGAHK